MYDNSSGRKRADKRGATFLLARLLPIGASPCRTRQLKPKMPPSSFVPKAALFLPIMVGFPSSEDNFNNCQTRTKTNTMSYIIHILSGH